MMLRPTIEEIRQLAQTGQYKVAPVIYEILSDKFTPVEVLRVLKNVSEHTYLLESAVEPDSTGRYTFLGYNPTLSISCKNGEMIIGDKHFVTPNPSDEIRKILADYKSPKLPGFPPFTGGLVGYFAYDFLGYEEPAAKTTAVDTEDFKDLDLMLFDKVIVFDNYRKKLLLIANMSLENVEAGYEKAKAELKKMEDLIRHGRKAHDEPGHLTGPVKPMFDKEQFCKMVERGKHHIHEGDIFQIVLSNRLEAPFEGSLLNTYRLLRSINPSPYMFYFSGTDVEVAGASPETLVKLEDGVLHTFPLAGTRPRGKSDEEDKELERGLLKDEKELAEHNMLVDLGRNDLGRVSRFGSVKVEKLREVVRYSHVMHIGSTVRGDIRSDKDAMDAISAVLPAGTLSGAPKIRAMQLIGELENNKRGIYGGAVGYVAFNGDMDTAIAIRLAYKKNGKVFARSGAGIVADSVPETEYQECINKAAAVIRALEEARDM
ncbi:MAG: anthranilate synthase component I family protein [Lachnospiraceae bacterium]|nr:anthranilate synthase component I family protein [Lachnospiraceae bacterium]